MYNVVKYNDTLLYDVVTKIIDIDVKLLANRSYNTIDFAIKNGLKFNGSKYESLKIEIRFFLKKNNVEEYRQALKELRELFNVVNPMELYLSENKFCYAISSDGIELDKVHGTATYGTIHLVALEPYFYNEVAKNIEGTTNLIVENEGTEYTPSIFTLNTNSNAHFIQVEKVETGEKILLGNYPSVENTTVKEKTLVINDNCESTSKWTISNAPIDSDRGFGGTLSITDTGNGICPGVFGTGSSLWRGVCARTNTGTSISDFEITAVMRHNSTGTSGDPSKVPNDTETVISGKTTYYYKVNSTTVTVRSSADSKSKALGTLKKGTAIKTYTTANGWLKFDYKFKSGYIQLSSLKKYKSTTKVTAYKKNFVTKVSTAIRTTPSLKAKNLKTIPPGTVIRCNTTTYTNGTYYKLDKKYNGVMGYVYISNLTQASDVEFDYEADEDLVTSDDKTGMIEIYGFTANNEKLFCLGLYDDNKYYEFTYPKISVGANTFLFDKTVAPAPKYHIETTESNGKLTVTKVNDLSGRYGTWNEFYGKLIIRRITKNNKQYWYAEVLKIKDNKTIKALTSKEITHSNYPKGDLSYIALYMGTSNDTDEKASCVALNDLKVKNLNPKVFESNNNVIRFESGDEIKVDCCNNNVTLNNENFRIIDIGSNFFELSPGINTIKISSDDTGIVSSCTFNERSLGDE